MGFQQGLSGLNVASKNLDVIGNNVANSGTVGFKSGQAQFADVFASSLSGAGSTPVGLGAKLAAVAQQFTQGNITTTNNPLDIAINGGGFFMVSQPGTSTPFYSRNGQFSLDSSNHIVNNEGYRLQGYPVDATGNILVGSTPSDLTVSRAKIDPLATGASPQASGVAANLNLDSREPAINQPFDFGDPTTYNRSTALTIYDSLGNPHTYTMYFAKSSPGGAASAAVLANGGTAPQAAGAQTMGDAVIAAGGTAANAGDVIAAVLNSANAGAASTAIGAIAGLPAAVVTAAQAAVTAASFPAGAFGAAAGVATAADTAATAAVNQWKVYSTVTNPTGTSPAFTDLSAGGTTVQQTLNFNTTGSLPAGYTATPQVITAAQLGYASGVNNMSFKVDFGSSTQFGSGFTVNSLAQDGFASGELAGFNVGSDGVIKGNYTNGQSKNLGQVALANFANPQGLQPQGNNRWAVTSSSGVALINVPGAGGTGVLQSAAVEDSNVDLTAELVNMITAQRVYQANAQTIKTQDAVLQTLVNLR